jgi:hypothetical protein
MTRSSPSADTVTFAFLQTNGSWAAGAPPQEAQTQSTASLQAARLVTKLAIQLVYTRHCGSTYSFCRHISISTLSKPLSAFAWAEALPYLSIIGCKRACTNSHKVPSLSLCHMTSMTFVPAVQFRFRCSLAVQHVYGTLQARVVYHPYKGPGSSILAAGNV